MSPKLDHQRLDLLYNFLEESVERGEIPGAAVQLSIGDKPSVSKAFGRFKPNLATPMQQDSIFLV
ncbi:MAG: hypothetical protein ACO4AV_16215, partial [bacterium]